MRARTGPGDCRYGREVLEQDEENNGAELAFTFAPKPEDIDLEVVSFTAQPAEAETGDPVRLTVTVRNNGTAAAAGNLVVWRSLREGGDKEAEFAASLAAGETREYVFIETVYQPGQFQYTACADPSNVVYEANEGNNQKTVAVLVRHLFRAATVVSATIRRENVWATFLGRSDQRVQAGRVGDHQPAGAGGRSRQAATWILDLDAATEADLAQYDILMLNYNTALQLAIASGSCWRATWPAAGSSGSTIRGICASTTSSRRSRSRTRPKWTSARSTLRRPPTR